MGVAVTVELLVPLALGVPVALGVRLSVCDRVSVPLVEDVCISLGICDTDGVPVAVMDAVCVRFAVSHAVTDWDGVTEGVWLTDAVCVCMSEGVAAKLGVCADNPV